ncbi:hypothetical protein BHAOGJBA_0746 [Methylobacterium hispanicum]|uniref:Uncharacterized protein n=1 Tax=Methylobacterium hispanicum TaxID=270350 RepID=A0AAV4ZFP8_9HYPH|nr:hypothetical protein [Methylobacterium hispanicum]GJD87246.1 hypothetical protein BHAOGJBA_0746 [Methylobacterium hispanicum]
MTPVALVALYCLAAAPAPLVTSDVNRVLRGEPVAAAPARGDVAAAAREAARHRRRHP